MIPLVKSTFYHENETKRKLTRFIASSEKLSFGKECELFEKKFAKWQGQNYCVFLNSGSSANLAIIQTLLNLGKLKKGDKVGFSALTWSTNVMPLIQLGLNAIPIDVEINTLNVSSQKIKETLEKEKITALFLTNLLGFCDDIDIIKQICDQNNILLIEDNCESLGSEYKNHKLGNFGLASTFSFYVGHHMSTIEGGAVCTNSEEVANMLKLVRAHGWDRNLSLAKQQKIRNKYNVNSTFYSRYTFYDLGYNLRPTEISGFIGNVQLSYLNEIIDKREKNFVKLHESISKRSDLFFPLEPNLTVTSSFAYPLVCRSANIRDKIVARCENKVEIRPIVGGNIAKQPFFMKYKSQIDLRNSNAEIVHEQGLYFGNNPELTDNELQYLIKIFTSDL